MKSERILQLLAKQMGREASAAEIAELQKLLQEQPEYLFFIEILQSLEGEPFHQEPAIAKEELIRESWSMLQQELNDPKARGEEIRKRERRAGKKAIPIRRWIRQAAIWAGLIIAAGGALFAWRHWKKQPTQQAVAEEKLVVAPDGRGPERISLPDSSVVWLNAGTRLRYADNFIQNTREVYLEGEAYFDVKDDAKHPFLVHAGNIVISVLGTAFNVQAYRNENRIETTLIKGKVQIQIAGKPDKKIILEPNEKLIVINDGFNLSGADAARQKERSFQVQEAVPAVAEVLHPEVAWVGDELAFENEPFDELAKRMERRYAVHILFRDSVLGDERLSGVFENETIQKALKLLQMTTPFRYRIEGDTVYLNR